MSDVFADEWTRSDVRSRTSVNWPLRLGSPHLDPHVTESQTMPQHKRILIISDIHYAGEAERQRRGYEIRIIRNPALRLAVRLYRRFVWQRDPFAHNHLLDEFLRRADSPDFVVANGDYSCDTAFVGVSDDAACQSAVECLTKLRHGFKSDLATTIGDHELGKLSLVGGQGGMRLASWHRTQRDLQLQPFWQIDIGRYALLGVTSSLIAFPVLEPESLPAERREWRALRDEHLAEVRQAFARLKPKQRVLLFCHDPTALPFLGREDEVRRKLDQVEHTVVGHLHSDLILWKSRLLAGMPAVRFLGNSVRRMSEALSDARHWKPFKVKLCPAIAGIELLKDGGFHEMRLDEDVTRPARFLFHPLRRR